MALSKFRPLFPYFTCQSLNGVGNYSAFGSKKVLRLFCSGQELRNRQSTSNAQFGDGDPVRNSNTLAIGAAIAIAVGGLSWYKWQKQVTCKPAAIEGPVEIPASLNHHAAALQERSGGSSSQKEYTKAEVSQHRNPDTGIWVTYKGKVYDVTHFVGQHPGGEKILLAAGGALEPFWGLYAVHKTPEVQSMLQEMLIGSLKQDPDDVAVTKDDDPYAGDPTRHPALMVNAAKPFNAEPPPELVIDSWITPNELFFVRNHLPVPKIDPKTYRLEVVFEGGKHIKLTLDQLRKKFPVHTVTASLQCAGNRRSEMSQYKPVKGLSWNFTAISNARWTGVYLRDVLKYAGYKEYDAKVHHVQFEGYDKDPTGNPYGASVPVEKATGPFGDVLLAFEMNGEELPRDHGYPIRVIVPGIVGARNVKWLSRIILSEIESQSHWQQNDYKGFSPSVDWDTVDFKKSPAVQEYPTQSAICHPKNGSHVDASEKTITVKGYAWSGGGREIIRVDVSGDGGKSWLTADLQREPQGKYRAWAWTLWEVEVPIPAGSKMDIVCKTIDDSYNVQPDTVKGVWNLRGLLNNSWHHVGVHVNEEE